MARLGKRRRRSGPRPSAPRDPRGAPPAATPTAAKPAQAEGVSRRGFLKWTTIGWVAFSAACTSSLVATARFLFPNVLFEPPQSFKAGFPGEYKFKCPCHGSGFYKTGVNFEGPAPRPLERARIVLADDGQILVDKSVKFQQEKGEWTKEESFLKV